jgi:hypothetical protein
LAYIAHLFEQRRLKLERAAVAAAAEAAPAPPPASSDVSGSAAVAALSTADRFDVIDGENSSLSCIDETTWDQEDGSPVDEKDDD